MTNYMAFPAMKEKEQGKFANRYSINIGNVSGLDAAFKKITDEPSTFPYDEYHDILADAEAAVIFDIDNSTETNDGEKRWYFAFAGEKHIRTALVKGTQKQAKQFVQGLASDMVGGGYPQVISVENVGVVDIHNKISDRVTRKEEKIEILKKHVDDYIKR